MSPCEVIQDGKGATIILCRRGLRARQRCCICGANATRLCDHQLEAGNTCDLPMCSEHATKTGRNRDLCPAHARQEQPELF